MKNYYITCAIPYVNARPHVGHALEFVQGDAVARYHRLLDQPTVFLSGGDENALKNVQAAEAASQDVQSFVDLNSLYFEELAKKLDISFDVFQKGSIAQHHASSQKLWELCAKSGDIYSKTYSGLYCVGCEAFYEDSELINGECVEHPGKKLEEVSEENYFFKLSRYQKQIEELLTKDVIKIIPESRKNEALAFVGRGLVDISISRSNARARNWGVMVPGDSSQRMYVWFDALNIYQSGVGFGWDEEKYENTWPADVHIIGKGILRFHAVYWPAFLLSAGLALPKSIFVHGYFTVDGQKMSKTLGNVVDPIEISEKYGVDALRYYFLREIPSTSDGDFSERRLRELYSSDLANGIGNAVARVAKLCETSGFAFENHGKYSFSKDVNEAFEAYAFDRALECVVKHLRDGVDLYFDTHKPWEKEGEELNEVLAAAVEVIRQAAFDLAPFLPGTATRIQEQYLGETISSAEGLFPRLS